MNISYSKLNTQNPSEIEEYEKLLFESFKNDKVMVSIYNCDYQNQRLKAVIPYEDQRIYVARDENHRIVASAAMNYNYNSRLLLEILGFKIDRSQPLVEALTFFSTIRSIETFFILSELKNMVKKDIFHENIYKVLISCSEKLKHLYSLVGFEEIDVIEINGEKEYMMVNNDL